jgi:hypothetical protein
MDGFHLTKAQLQQMPDPKLRLLDAARLDFQCDSVGRTSVSTSQ